jgi:hypothetical protein
MTTTFLDYYKMILDKVSFDPRLLSKEYQKAKRDLHSDEIGDLNRWLMSKKLPVNFSDEGQTSTLR